MRRIFALLLLTPLLANCADSATPVAPAGAVLSEGEVPTEWEVLTDEPWITSEDVSGGVTLMGAPGAGVAMTFGNPDAGSNFPPGAHDASFHGRDRIIPGTVVVDVGQPVTFHVNIGHRVAIYKEGVRPEDISPNNPGPFVLDPVNRVALQAAPVPSLSWTFAHPGRYLVICAVKSHFFVANMYGWVIVR